MTLLNYPRENEFQPVVIEFNQFYKLMTTSQNVRNAARRKGIDNLEARLISIISTAIDGDEYDQRWLAAGRQEINECFKTFNRIRFEIEKPRPQEAESDINRVQTQFSSTEELFLSTGSIFSAAALSTAYYGLIAGSIGATISGAASFSFFGGPMVGAAVTIPTATVSLVGTIGASIYGGIHGANRARHDLEAALRAEFIPSSR